MKKIVIFFGFFISTIFISYLNAIDWYVRPQKVGVYGSGDGTSYTNAWNGIKGINWGGSFVNPGDHIYVCGTHLYDKHQGSNAIGSGPVTEYIGISGTSGSPITIRMDCPGDEGFLWGIARYGGPQIVWNGPDSNGVYWTNNFHLRYGGAAECNGPDCTWLKMKHQDTWVGDSGSVYNKKGVDYDGQTRVKTVYVKTTDGSHPQDKIYSEKHGYKFIIGSEDYITFYKCNFFNSPISAGKNGVDSSKNIVIDSCRLQYDNTIHIHAGFDNWTIRNSELSHMSVGGIYTHTPGNMYNLTVENNYFHDIGVTPYFPPDDGHPFGAQNLIGGTFAHNRTENTGSVEFWSGNYDMKDILIYGNFISNTHIMPVTGGGGIVISNGNIPPGKRTGFKIYSNIIQNTGIGMANPDWRGSCIIASITDPIEIYNNTCRNINTGRGAIQINANNYAAQAKIHNNIVVNLLRTESEFTSIYGGDFTNWNVNFDNNLYFPNANINKKFFSQKHGNPKNFSGWQSFGYDLNGLAMDPMFVSDNPLVASDFSLKVNSPAVDAGIDVGLLIDYLGTSIPQGNLPDMGALEYKKINSPPILNPISNYVINENELLTFFVFGLDADNDTLTYYLAPNLALGSSFRNGIFNWIPSISQSGIHNLTFVVSDGRLTDFKTIQITVNDTFPANPPILAPIGNKVASEGVQLQIWLSATDLDGDLVTFKILGSKPQGSTLNGSNFTWTPAVGQTGVYQVNFVASDGQLTDQESIQIIVQ